MTIIQLLRDSVNFKNINQNIWVKDGLIFLEWCDGVYGTSSYGYSKHELSYRPTVKFRVMKKLFRILILDSKVMA